MNRLEWFEQNKNALHHGLKLGLISPSLYGKYLNYLVFLRINQSKMRTASVNETAELMKCSATTVWESVAFFEEGPHSDFSDYILPPQPLILAPEQTP